MKFEFIYNGILPANMSYYSGTSTPQEYVEGMDKLTINIKREETTTTKEVGVTNQTVPSGSKTIGASGSLTFRGKDYEFIKYVLMDDPNAISNQLFVNLIDDCCGKTYNYIVLAESIDLDCYNCSIELTLTEWNTETQIYQCLANNFITDGMEPDNPGNPFYHSVPRFVYCNDIKPTFLAWTILWLGVISLFIFYILAPMVVLIAEMVTVWVALYDTVATIWNAIASVFGLGKMKPINLSDTITDIFKGWEQMRDGLTDSLLNCGRTHPAPYISQYLDNICSKCGIAWQSSIFSGSGYNGDYKTLCLMSSPVTKGTHINSSQNWIEEDKPILTGIQFLDLLKGIFNADYRIVNNVLIFERRDYFYNLTPAFDLRTVSDKILSCDKRWLQRRPAFGDFKYMTDAFDQAGNEAKARFNSIVNWAAGNLNLSGSKDITLNDLSPCRARHDNVDKDIEPGSSGEPLDFFEKTFGGNAIFPIFGELSSKYHNAWLLSNGMCFTYKLFIEDTTPGIIKRGVNGNEWRAIIQNADGTQTVCQPAVNYPMWLNGNIIGGNLYGSKNLYENFWYIENPNVNLIKNIQEDISFVYDDCTEIQGLDINSGVINLDGVNCKITEIDIDSFNKTIKLSLLL